MDQNSGRRGGLDAPPLLQRAADVLLGSPTRWRSRLVRDMAPGRHDTILEIGCGSGGLAAEIARAAPSAQFLGLDRDANRIARARLRAELGGHAHLAFAVGDHRDAPTLVGQRAPNRAIANFVGAALGHDERNEAIALLRDMLPSEGILHVIADEDSLGPDARFVQSMLRRNRFVAVDVGQPVGRVGGAVRLLSARAN